MVSKNRVQSLTKLLVIISVAVMVVACNGPAAQRGPSPQSTPFPTPTPLPTPVRILQSTIAADGEVVLPIPAQRFGFEGVTGTIAEVYVVAGQFVEEGDLLARVDDTDLRRAVEQAQASLDTLRAQIASEEAPALPGDIAEAQASLTAARAELQRLRDLPEQESIDQAAADLRVREIELQQAQEAYDEIAYVDNIGLTPQAADLQTATINYERALAVYNEAVKPATEAQLTSAQSQVVQAENQLQKLLDGPRAEARAWNQAQLDERQLSLDEAEYNLTKANLYAPWDGQVTAVEAAPGVSVGNASVTLAQTEPLRFATSNFSERNLADIEVGAIGTIFLKTYPGVPFPAVVQRIELESTARDGDTALFTVYLDFNSGDFTVRPGMTGRLEINIDRPNR